MINIFNLFQNTFNNRSYRLIHKYKFQMDKAYLRHVNDSEQFQISFRYADLNKVDRQFNFCRQLNETVGTFLSRITTNVEKVINKKYKREKSNAVAEENNVISAKLLLNGTPVNDDQICKELFIPDSTKKLVLTFLQKEYLIIVNSPWINGLNLPKSIMANFPVYPSKFDADITDRKLCEFNWYKSENKTDWSFVGSGFMYLPKYDDIKNYLKLCCLPKNEHAEGPLVETISDVQVEANPGHCPFETRHRFTAEKVTGTEFRVVSYNILADLYTDSDYSRNTLFSYCPAYALSMDYRKQLILKELVGYNADIICLQELDKKIFLSDIQPIFNSLGYSCTLQLKGGEVAEGLGCIFNNTRFSFLESTNMVYGQQIDKDPLFSDIWDKISLNPKSVERFTQRSSVIDVTALASCDNDEILLVANTHLYFHPDSDHIRLLQGGVAIRFIEDLIRKWEVKTTKRISLIFCGDFNSVPECGIYQLYTKGFVSDDCIDWQSNKDEAIRGLTLTQSLQIGSACGAPAFTNYTAGFADCLDYIYYSKNNFQVVQVVPFPSNQEVMENVALPSIVHPSDHVALVADLKWL